MQQQESITENTALEKAKALATSLAPKAGLSSENLGIPAIVSKLPADDPILTKITHFDSDYKPTTGGSESPSLAEIIRVLYTVRSVLAAYGGQQPPETPDDLNAITQQLMVLATEHYPGARVKLAAQEFKTIAESVVTRAGEIEAEEIEAAKEARLKAASGGNFTFDEELKALIPAKNPHWVSSPEFEIILREVATAKPEPVLMTGPTGSGKTQAAYEIAARLQRPILKMDVALYRNAADMLGHYTLAGGETKYRPSLLVKALETPGSIVLLDEISRASSDVLNALFGLMDDTRRAYSEELGRYVTRHESVIVLATANIGAQYVGVKRLDAALKSRMTSILECGYLPKDQEAKLLSKSSGIPHATAKKLAAFAESARGAYLEGRLSTPVTTRMLLKLVLSHKETGIPLEELAVARVFGHFDHDPMMGENSPRSAVRQMWSMNVGSDGGAA